MSALDKLLMSKYREAVLDPPARLEAPEAAPTETDACRADGAEEVVAHEEPAPMSDAPCDEAEPAALRVTAAELSGTEPQSPAEPQSVGGSQTEQRSDELLERSESDSAKATNLVPMSFKPDWEVDRFIWPAICEEVEGGVSNELSVAVECIQRDCQNHESNIVAVTNEKRGAGGTTMSLCLAREASRQGLSVALVDLNHANPTLMDRLGVEFEKGIESLKGADATVESICVAAIEDGISLLPTTRMLSADDCVDEAVQELIEIVTANHDLVLIDASTEVAELMVRRDAFGRFGAIVVTDDSSSDEEQMAFSARFTGEKLASENAWTVGVIENFAA